MHFLCRLKGPNKRKNKHEHKRNQRNKGSKVLFICHLICLSLLSVLLAPQTRPASSSGKEFSPFAAPLEYKISAQLQLMRHLQRAALPCPYFSICISTCPPSHPNIFHPGPIFGDFKLKFVQLRPSREVDPTTCIFPPKSDTHSERYKYYVWLTILLFYKRFNYE